MNFFEQLSVMKHLDSLIRRKATGTSQQLAGKLKVSRATVFRYINDLKAIGAPIDYCSIRQSYYYQESYELKL